MSTKKWGAFTFPKQRPRSEWEHVHVTESGGRYVDVDELLSNKSVQDKIAEVANLHIQEVPDHEDHEEELP